MEIIFNRQISKVRQLADAMSLAISKHEFKEGESLPSINQLSRKYGITAISTDFRRMGEVAAQLAMKTATALRKVKHLIHTITDDNGKEFAKHEGIIVLVKDSGTSRQTKK